MKVDTVLLLLFNIFPYSSSFLKFTSPLTFASSKLKHKRTKHDATITKRVRSNLQTITSARASSTRDDQDLSSRWVVLVDDEASIRKAVGQYLEDYGYSVTACADVDSALKVCRSRGSSATQFLEEDGTLLPDIIVSDVRMPGKTGLEFLHLLREDERLKGVPVVLLTAKGATEDRIKGYKAGTDAYLPKPFDPEELLSIMDNVIQRHEALNGKNVEVEDLSKDLDEIKNLLGEDGGGGVGNGWVKDTNVFFTPDEKDILEFLCQGLMNQEIAEKIFLSQRRVEQILTSMFRKTKVTNRTELVRWAVAAGMVEV